MQEQDVPTEYGLIKVAIQGNTKKPAIITYHDIGLNRKSSFLDVVHLQMDTSIFDSLRNLIV